MAQDKRGNFDIKRGNYFQGMMLVDKDFKDEQTYHRQMRQNHNLELHTWGVVRGLDVSLGANGAVTVTEGLAIDASGREVWWKGGAVQPAGASADGSSLVIEWNQEERDEYPQMAGKHLRLIDTASFSWKSDVGDNDVVLARLLRGQPDNRLRRNAASVRANGNDIEIGPVTRDGALRLMTGAPLTARLTVDASGNVGIGTANPTERLDVRSSGPDVIMNFRISNSDASSFIDFYPGMTGDFNPCVIWKEGAPLRFATATRFERGAATSLVERIRISGEGRVGIGTSAPQGALHIKGIAGVLNLEGADHAYVQWYPAGYDAGRKGWIGYGSVNGKNLTIQNEYAEGHLNLLSASGRVGIGVRDPQTALDVNGDLSVRGGLWFANNEGRIYPDGWVGEWDNGGPKWMHIGGITDGGVRRLLLAAQTTIGGNVGIGTDSPAAALQVRNTTANNGGASFFNGVSALFVCKENNGGNSAKPPETVMVLAREGIEGQSYANFARFDLGIYGLKKTQLDVRLSDDPGREGNNTPVIMSLRSNGNVGIGTNAPKARLEIQGGASSTGDGDPQAMAFAYFSGGFRHWIRTRHNSTPGRGNAIDFYVNNSTTADGSSAPTTGTLHAMTLDAGRVGIGTTNPVSRLTVLDTTQPAETSAAGAMATPAMNIIGGKGGNTTASGQKAGLGASIQLRGGHGGDAPAGGTNGDGGSILLSPGKAGSGAGAAGKAGNVTLAPEGGNVGIGTTSPSAALQVRPTPGDTGSATFFNGAGAMLATASNNGGSALAPAETALVLTRAGIGAQAYANFARFDLKRYENVDTRSRTQLDLRLSHENLGDEANNTPVILSLRSNGNVGIGTIDPGTNRLRISSQIGGNDPGVLQHNFQLEIRNSIGNRAFAIGLLDNGKGVLQAKEVNVGYNDLLLNPVDGNVGIGTSTTGAKLDVNGDVKISGRVSCGGWIALKTFHGSFVTANDDKQSMRQNLTRETWEQFKLEMACSRDLKENIADISAAEAMATLAALNPVKYDYKAGKAFRQNLGFIAEEMPDNLATEDRKTISPFEVIPILTKVVKEQQQSLARLQEMILALQNVPGNRLERNDDERPTTTPA